MELTVVHRDSIELPEKWNYWIRKKFSVASTSLVFWSTRRDWGVCMSESCQASTLRQALLSSRVVPTLSASPVHNDVNVTATWGRLRIVITDCYRRQLMAVCRWSCHQSSNKNLNFSKSNFTFENKSLKFSFLYQWLHLEPTTDF